MIAAAGLLSACQPQAPGLSPNGTAPGIDARGEATDQALVGHRLMAAGEYELALRAYYRAAIQQGFTASVLASIGTAHLRLGRLNQAEDLLRRAIDADETYVSAWNNLGVVLLEKGEWGESAQVFRTAVALDSGQSAEIRENLSVALAKLENPGYSPPEDAAFELMRRGQGDYLLMSTE